MQPGPGGHLPQDPEAGSEEAARPQTTGRELSKETTHERVRRQFTKTEYCRFWPNCKQGNHCVFAHGIEEKRTRPNLRKTSLCANWQAGRCALRSRDCQFAHGYYEMKATEEFKMKKKEKQNQDPDAADDQVEGSPSELPNNPSLPSNTLPSCAVAPCAQHQMSHEISGLLSQEDCSGPYGSAAQPFQVSTIVGQAGAAEELPAWAGGSMDVGGLVGEPDEGAGNAQSSSSTLEHVVDMHNAYVIARLYL